MKVVDAKTSPHFPRQLDRVQIEASSLAEEPIFPDEFPMNLYHKLSRPAIEFGLMRMNTRVLFGSVLGVFMLLGMFAFAPGDLASTWQCLVYNAGLAEVSFACWLLRVLSPRFISKSWGIKAFRTCFIFHSSLYAICSGLGISFLFGLLEGTPYSISVLACLLFACAVVVSSFAFDLVICVNYIILGLAAPTYVSIFVLKDGLPIAVTCVMSMMFFSFLAYMIHKAEVETIFGEETIRKQAAELKASYDTIATSNDLFQNTLNSIDEIFLTLDRDGICFGNIAEKTASVLGLSPTGLHFTDILRLEGKPAENARSWFKSATSKLQFFHALQAIGPTEWIDRAQGKTFRVQYFAMHLDGVINAVIMTLSDVTAQLLAKKNAESAEARSMLILAVSENRLLFGKFIRDALEIFEKISSWPLGELVSLKRELHTLKGTAAVFQVRFLAGLINNLEVKIRDLKAFDETARAAIDVEAQTILSELKAWLSAESKTLQRLRVFAPEEISIGIDHQRLVRSSFADEPHGQENFDRVILRLQAQSLNAALAAYEGHVQKVAVKLGKEVQFHYDSAQQPVLFTGDELTSMTKSLVHIFNNAVDHALETPAARTAAGKARGGAIRVSLSHDDTAVTIQIEDDGAGIDVRKLRQKLAEKGVEANFLSDDQVLHTIFDAGVSTKSSVDEISGHGIGLNALHEDVVKLGGTLDVKTALSQGTRFRITIPLKNQKLFTVPQELNTVENKAA